MCNIDKLEITEGLNILKQAGLASLPGGGAEIFDESVRNKISPEKPSGQLWLNIHRIAHLNGLPSNATMLFGHIESRAQRIGHISALRSLQDETHGFNCFIPLKFRRKNNSMSDIDETNIIEDLKTYAVARIFLDNIPHLKASGLPLDAILHKFPLITVLTTLTAQLMIPPQYIPAQEATKTQT